MKPVSQSLTEIRTCQIYCCTAIPSYEFRPGSWVNSWSIVFPISHFLRIMWPQNTRVELSSPRMHGNCFHSKTDREKLRRLTFSVPHRYFILSSRITKSNLAETLVYQFLVLYGLQFDSYYFCNYRCHHIIHSMRRS